MERLLNYSRTLPVNELYTAVQGEGSRAGYPTVVVRVSGCTHRCYFKEGGWCDSWYSSIHAEPGKYTIEDIVKMYKENPHIKEMMLTGGSPTMYPQLVNELTHFCHKHEIFLTIETEGSSFVETDYPINLLSISPKFSNSVPTLGTKTPKGQEVDQRFINYHNRYRLNVDVIQKMIDYHLDYHIKPVWDGNDKTSLLEIENFLEELKIPKSKVWFMPAGDSREALFNSYPKVMNFCRDRGYNFTGRPHIIAFNQERKV